MIQALNDRRLAWLLMLFGAVMLLVLMFTTQGQYNDGDSITHYLISRFSFRHPLLFLHHWGKPLFTLLSAPFSQFGFYGIETFNVVCVLFSAWLAYRIAAMLELPRAPLAILFVLFTPVYLLDTLTGLTEPLFGLVLIAGIWLVMKDKAIWAAIVISFLPFARSEGYLMFPLFGMCFLLMYRYWAIPFLAAGFLVYSIIGYFAFGDFMWVINQNPYGGAAGLYGHGELLHFVKHYKDITGIPLAVLFVLGVAAFLVGMRNNRQFFSEKRTLVLFWLVYGTFIMLVAAHSVFWWKGIFGSLGLYRVVAGVVPTFGIICLMGCNALLRLFSFSKKVQTAFAAIIVLLVVIPSVGFLYRVAHLDDRAAAVQQACRWVKEQNLADRMIYYSHPFTVVSLDLDPNDDSEAKELMYTDTGHFSNSLKDSSITIWESQFGPHESHTPLDSLRNPAFFKLLKTVTPYDTSYKVMVFEKIR